MAQELCMKPSALPRSFSFQVSDTSAAPLAHSPPIPKPRKMRNTANCANVCAKPHAAVKTEYTSTLSISARVRPHLSASTPKIRPPAADASSVSDCSDPAVAASMPSSLRTASSTSAYNMTSNESSIQPSEAATSDFRAVRSASCHQLNMLLTTSHNPRRRGFLPADDLLRAA